MTLMQRSLEALGVKSSDRPTMATGSSAYGLGAGGGGLGSQRNLVSQMAAMGGVGWLFAAVSRITSAVAATEWHLLRQRGDEWVHADDHPAMALWRSVNPFYTQGEFIETFQQHLDLTGEAWWVLLRNARGVPVEMWAMRPDRMHVIPDADEYVRGYIYKMGSEELFLDRNDVVFLRMPNPLDPYRGLGPVQAILTDIDSEQLATQWTRNFFRNSAEPGGIIELAEGLDDASWERMRTRWQSQHQGVANAHRVAILEKGRWVDRKITQRDMQFEQLRKLSRDTILGAFGMPASVMGLSENVNRANAEAGEVMFARWIVRPRLQRIKEALNERLAPLFGPDLMFDYEDPVPENRELNLEEAERGFTSGILTRNEARARLGEGEADMGGDEFAPPGQGALAAPEPVRRTPGSGREVAVLPPAITTKAPEDDSLWPEAVRAERRHMATAWEDRLEAELDALVEHFEQFTFPEIRIAPEDAATYNWDWAAKYGPLIEAELDRAFSAAATAQFAGMPPGELQLLAGDYARDNGAKLITRTSDFTKLRVNLAVEQTIANGEGLGRLQKRLRDDMAFSKHRSRLIARTEAADALGAGAKEAARLQGRNEKSWITQGDGQVDDVCVQNEGAGWIPASALFPSGHDRIPAHIQCRCNTRYRTAELHSESYKTFCPRCEKRLPVNNAPPGVDLYCAGCRHTWTVVAKVAAGPARSMSGVPPA